MKRRPATGKEPLVSHADLKELAYRNQDGVEVTLLWEPRSDGISVEVIDHLDGSEFRVPVAGHLASDAFHHPYAFAQELRASRARLVEAGDAARRRLERDLHDGAQARLVALAMLLGRARTHAACDPELEALLHRATDELQASLTELRELARGMHPAVLTDRGLEPALQALVARAPVPVTVEVDTGARLPGAVESAAYFVVSEALANVAKYAHATSASVTVRRRADRITIAVTDDGIGGANAAHGSGLRGLADRVAALEGALAVDSPEGRGTRLRAEIPFRA